MWGSLIKCGGVAPSNVGVQWGKHKPRGAAECKCGLVRNLARGMSCGEATHLASYRLNRSMIFSSSSSARDRS